MNADTSGERADTDRVLARLVHKYVELSEACYRVAVVAHDKHGRFAKGHRARRPHPALLKKVDLDRALARVYQRFFGSSHRSGATAATKGRGGGGDVGGSPKEPPSGPGGGKESV